MIVACRAFAGARDPSAACSGGGFHPERWGRGCALGDELTWLERLDQHCTVGEDGLRRMARRSAARDACAPTNCAAAARTARRVARSHAAAGADVAPRGRAKVPVEAADVLGLDVQPRLRDHRRAELIDGRLEVEPRRDRAREFRERAHQRKVVDDAADDCRVAHLDRDVAAARQRRAVQLRDRAARERLRVRGSKASASGAPHAASTSRLVWPKPWVGACEWRRERSARPLGEDVGPARRPLAPLDERGARRRERRREHREPHAVAEERPRPREERGEEHGQEDDEQYEGAREQRERPRRPLLDEPRLLARRAPSAAAAAGRAPRARRPPPPLRQHGGLGGGVRRLDVAQLRRQRQRSADGATRRRGAREHRSQHFRISP